jgi:dolichyl-diphosphooligosaccharide--protein glycosyltransferase
LAWYPIASAVITAGLVYVLAVRLFEDRRVGLASVALLAVTPAHAYRTALGFADHHAFDYPWLVATVLALTVLTSVDRSDLEDRTTWLWTAILGIAVAGQTLAWDAAPILLAPIGLYSALATAHTVQSDRSPTPPLLILGAGLSVAAFLTHAAHATWNWHTDQVTYGPALLVGAVIALALLGALADRFDRSGRDVIVAETALGFGGAILFAQLLPEYASRLVSRLEFLFFTEGIAETASIVGGEMGTIVGPILVFGFVFFLGIPYLTWAGWRVWRGASAAWLPAVIYGATFTLLASIQLRFGGELAPILAVFAGLGFAHLASVVDLARRPPVFDGGVAGWTWTVSLPERRTTVSLIVLFALVASLGVVQTGVKTSQLTIDGEMHNAAQWMEENAAHRNLSTDGRYVFSEWGRNRVYNYFVRGQSRSYAYAQRNYGNFTAASSPGNGWYSRLADHPTGYVVMKDRPGSPARTMQATLQDRLGSRASGVPGSGHFQAVWRSSDQSTTVFRPVLGARIVGTADPGSVVSADTRIAVSGQSKQYRRQSRANPYGVYALRFSYPGTFCGADQPLDVSELAVANGRTTKLHDREGFAHWPFDRTRNGRAFDRVGGHTARVVGTESVTGINGSALQFDEGGDIMTANVAISGPFAVNLWIKPTALDTTNSNDYRTLVRTDQGSVLVLEEHGAVSFRSPGIETKRLVGGDITTGEWSHVAAEYNGTHRKLYVNGQLVGVQPVSGDLKEVREIRLGSPSRGNEQHGFVGKLDDVRIFKNTTSRVWQDQVNSTERE